MLVRQIEQNLLFANQIDRDLLHIQANKLLNRRVDFCDLYLQSSLSESWALDEGIIKSGSFANTQGIGIRAICGEKTFLSYSNLINPTVINQLTDNLFIKQVNNQSVPICSDEIGNRGFSLYSIDNPVAGFSSIDKTNLLHNINNIARKLDYVTNVIANLSIEYDEIFIVRSDNKTASDIRPLVHLSISVIIEKAGNIERGSSGVGGRYSLDSYTLEILKFHIEKAHQQAILKTESIEAPKGQMPVVLGNGWAGVILHEAVGHGLEGDFNRKGTSAFSNKIGTQVASENVTIIDEGCIENRRGSLNIDDEGNQTRKNVLIENGILKGYMFDELNARLMGTRSTGNGRRESYASQPMPRMTNTYMSGGKYTHEEIIASVGEGLYAESFEGGQVDITSGQFVFNASNAWVIKNGKLAYPVKGCALVGSGPECLKYVSMVGSDLALDHGIGVCGKNGQSVPVGVGQPTIRIDQGLVVGGA